MSTEASFLEYWPSSIAAAAILCAANEIPNLSLVNPEHAESWCDGLSKVSSICKCNSQLMLGRMLNRKLVCQLGKISNFCRRKSLAATG